MYLDSREQSVDGAACLAVQLCEHLDEWGHHGDKELEIFNVMCAELDFPSKLLGHLVDRVALTLEGMHQDIREVNIRPPPISRL